MRTFLFVTTKGNLYHGGSINGVLSTFCRRHKIHLDVTTHILRYTFATRCFEAGISPKVIQTYLGHADISTTMNIYIHVDIMELKNNITKVSFA
ncbi:MAG TPA: tyrosine-type recombinase/integrase [Firmicutes bacterium]|nr:tyrosine-type recombinase/integrase [Bacillota bacterium]